MRYWFRSVLWVILFSICILGQLEAVGQVGQKKDFKSHLKHFEYFGLIHPPTFSPNGRYQVLISEDRYHGGSEFSLIFAITGNEGRKRSGNYCLTPRYLEVVAAPGGNISYMYSNSSIDYAVGMVLMGELKIIPRDEVKIISRMATIDTPAEQLQFSKDGQHFCYFMTFKPHPFQPPEIKREANLSRLFNPAGWMIYDENGEYLLREKGGFIFSKEEKEAFTEWAPIDKPQVIPQLFTQPMPKITLETQVRWSPDSHYIYVSDETGIWRVAPYLPFCPMWTKIVNAPRISNLQISSTGKHLLYEVRPDLLTRSDEENKEDPFGLHNEIGLVDIAFEPIRLTRTDVIAAKGDVWQLDITKELKPRIIAKGWGATFNPSGKVINYANEDGFFLLDIETLNSVQMLPTSYTIHYKRSILD